MNAEKIQDYVRTQEELFVQITKHLVEAESPSTDPSQHERVRSVLLSELRELGYMVREAGTIGGPRHIFARPKQRLKGTPAQLIIGHYDTVWPLGTLSQRPFARDGNVIRGPGAFDMKGGLAQILIALRTLRDLDLEPLLTPLIFINADEEIGSRTSTRFIRMLSRLAQRAFILEPAMGANGAIKTERKGIGRFTITVFGKAAHAGLNPESGVSAILELSHVIQSLFALNDPDAGISVNVGTIDGGLQPNVIAPNSKAVVDVRVPTTQAGKEIEETIYSLQPNIPGVKLRIEGGIGRPSMESTPRNRALWKQAHALGRDLGLDLKQVRVGGGSDGNTASQFTATLDGLGPVGAGAHAEHEHLYIDKTLDRAALLTLLLLSPSIKRCTTEDQA